MLAVAGSGKTTYLIDKLNLEKRFLIVTYTINNYKQLCHCILKKFGFYPDNIKVLTYFQFVYSFCFRPFYGLRKKAQGLSFDKPPEWTRYKTREDNFYMTSSGKMYYNRIAKFCQDNCENEIKERIDKYYDYFFVDEVQDIAGHDFNLLLSIIPERCSSLFVGDFYQHTYDTSNDGNVNSSLYNDYEKYIRRWGNIGIEVDNTSLFKTRRCCEEVCRFVNCMGIEIKSDGAAKGEVRYIDSERQCDEIITNSNIPKLFYQKSTDYNCFAMNWGESKGLDCFEDVCIVFNKTTEDKYKKRKLNELNAMTKNKLYVACTRPHRNLYLMSYSFLEKYKRNS